MLDLVRYTTNSLKSLITDVLKPTDSSSASNNSACDRLDFIIFGASGCMGRYTVLEAVNILKRYDFGIAGRNQKKLEIIIEEVEKRTSKNLINVPLIIANVEDQQSLKNMAESCKILINCCGPSYLTAEPVIQACLDSGTHYVDLCCDPHFIESIQFKYHEEAALKNVYIILACGLQSLPYEMAICFMEHNFNGIINSVDIYADYWSTSPRLFSSIGSLTSWYTIVESCFRLKDLCQLRTRLPSNIISIIDAKNCIRSVLHRSEIVNGVCLKFPLIDKNIFDRSQSFCKEENGKRPIQYNSYLVFTSYFRAILFLLWALLIFLMAQITSTSSLLFNYPRIFSLGYFASSCPDETFMNRLAMNLTVSAKGWSKSSHKKGSKSSIETNKVLKARLAGVNPIYGVACVCVLISAVTVLKERKRLPRSGGVYSPGVAFCDTSIIKHLQQHEHGLVFEIISDKNK